MAGALGEDCKVWRNVCQRFVIALFWPHSHLSARKGRIGRQLAPVCALTFCAHFWQWYWHFVLPRLACVFLCHGHFLLLPKCCCGDGIRRCIAGALAVWSCPICPGIFSFYWCTEFRWLKEWMAVWRNETWCLLWLILIYPWYVIVKVFSSAKLQEKLNPNGSFALEL